ncbi:MAG: hypothetical protein C0467_01455 [Planctomycetaceae bacterium]|nr:hypothetical protein [Planctomycetaceae bacterium]
MSVTPDRRGFLAASTAGAGSLAFLNQLPRVSAAEAKPDSKIVRLDSGIEQLVRLVEETPRDKLLEEVGSRIKKGLAYRDVLAALFLAGVRNIQPRPQVGFKFHAVMAVNAAHQASLAGPDRERWLPLFWALDNFKSAQAINATESAGWRMKPVDEAKVPPPSKARAAYIAAMDNWDVDAADTAVVGLARSATPGELFELFARYGSRDFRDIGHKAIFVACSFRTLDVIGWQHSEPVLRSLAYALQKHDGKNPAKDDLEQDRPGRKNAERVRTAAAAQGALPEIPRELLTALRAASADEMGAKVAELTAKGAAPRAIWEGLFLGAGELLMRQPGIIGLHTLTALNALHYAHQTVAADDTRKLLLLQAASFLPMFREAMKTRGKVGDAKIDELGPRDEKALFGVGDVYKEVSKNKETAARTAMSYLKANPDGAKELTDEGRRLIFMKGTDAHDYKFSTAVLEDAEVISPAWRDRFLAASLFWMKGSETPDSPLVKRTHAALA